MIIAVCISPSLIATPVAFKTAFLIAGATGQTEGSPKDLVP